MSKGNQQGADSRRKGEASPKAPDVFSALNHPLRRRLMLEWEGREASPSDLAKELDRPLSDVSYHVRVLIDCGVLELVRTQPVRGSVEHFYVPNAERVAQLRSFLVGPTPYDGRPQAAL